MYPPQVKKRSSITVLADSFLDLWLWRNQLWQWLEKDVISQRLEFVLIPYPVGEMTELTVETWLEKNILGYIIDQYEKEPLELEDRKA